MYKISDETGLIISLLKQCFVLPHSRHAGLVSRTEALIIACRFTGPGGTEAFQDINSWRSRSGAGIVLVQENAPVRRKAIPR